MQMYLISNAFELLQNCKKNTTDTRWRISGKISLTITEIMEVK